MNTTHAGVAFLIAAIAFVIIGIAKLVPPRNNWTGAVTDFALAVLSVGLLLTQ
jgi:hypothetical protein